MCNLVTGGRRYLTVTTLFIRKQIIWWVWRWFLEVVGRLHNFWQVWGTSPNGCFSIYWHLSKGMVLLVKSRHSDWKHFDEKIAMILIYVYVFIDRSVVRRRNTYFSKKKLKIWKKNQSQKPLIQAKLKAHFLLRFSLINPINL